MTDSRTHYDTVVVGGGVIGLAVAWRAARAGLSVLVVERGEFGGGTSRVAAGMLAPVAEALPSERPLLRLTLASAAAYPTFVAELAEQSGADAGYLDCGTLMVARDRDEAEALERELAARLELGLDVARLRASDARRLEPALAPALRLALELPGDHVIEPQRLTGALVAAARRAGAELQPRTEAVDVSLTGARIDGVVLAGGERVRAGAVVIAAGVWAGAIAGLPAEAMWRCGRSRGRSCGCTIRPDPAC